jgi:hypothetical protein
MLHPINICLRVIARLNSVLSDHIAATSNSSLDHSHRLFLWLHGLLLDLHTVR